MFCMFVRRGLAGAAVSCFDGDFWNVCSCGGVKGVFASSLDGLVTYIGHLEIKKN